MGKGSNTTQTSSNSSSSTRPDDQAYQAYQALLSRASGVAGTPYEAYGGEETAPINQQQQTGIGNINTQQGVIAGTGAPISAADIQRYQDPFTNQVIDATQRDFDVQNARQQSQVTGNAASQGALGGDRSAVAAALTAEGQGRSQAPVIAGLRSQGYQQAVKTAEDQQQQALRAGVAGLQGAQSQVSAGTLEQQTQQAKDTQGRQDYYQKQGYPFQVAQWLASIDTGVGSQMGGTGTNTGQSTTQGPTPNVFAQIAGLGLAGASMIPSDRRVKENVEKIGETNDGQAIYRFNYRGHPQTEIGLMHDEVEEAHPEATGRVGGVGVVDYHKATDDSVERFRGGRMSGVGRYAEGGGVGDNFNTKLRQPEELSFQAWKRLNAPNDSGADYDLRGAFDSGMIRDPESGHMGDRFKKPNHPTFSDQSQYAVGAERNRAGHWNGEDFIPPAIRGVGGRVHSYAGGGSPWGTDQTWIPQVSGISAGRGAPGAPSLPSAPSAPQQKGLSADQMKGIGSIGKSAYGGLDRWLNGDPGSFNSPMEGLTSADYDPAGAGVFARGGRIGFAAGGAPDDDPSFDERFGASFPRVAAGVGAARPAFGDDDVVNPDEPYRLPDRPSGDSEPPALEDWRSGVKRDLNLGQSAQADVPLEDKGPLPPEVLSGRSKASVMARGEPEEGDAGPSTAMGYAGRPRMISDVGTPASTPEGAPDEGFLSRLGIKMTPELRQGLLQAGLSMMATRHGGPGSFLQSAGEAGMTGVGAYSQTQQLAQEQAEKARKEAFEREKFEAPFSRMTAAQQETARHNKAVEAKDFKPTYGVIRKEIDPNTGFQREVMGWIDPNTRKTVEAPDQKIAAESVGSPVPSSTVASAAGYDYSKDAPRLDKGAEVPEPRALSGKSSASVKADAEYYAQTGKLPPVRAGQSPVAVVQQNYRNAVQNYGNALAESRGINPSQLAEMWRTAPGTLRFVLGADGRATVSLGTAVRHLDTLKTVADAWGSGDSQAINRIRAAIATQFGDEAATNLQAAGRIIGPEIIKAIGVAGAGTAEERKAVETAFSTAASPAQILGAIRTTQSLLGGQLEGRKRQAAAAGVSEEKFKSLIGDRPYEILSNAEKGHGAKDTGKGAPATISSKAEYDKLPSGAKFMKDGKEWTKP